MPSPAPPSELLRAPAWSSGAGLGPFESVINGSAAGSNGVDGVGVTHGSADVVGTFTLMDLELLLQKHHSTMMLQLNNWRLHQDQLVRSLLNKHSPEISPKPSSSDAPVVEVAAAAPAELSLLPLPSAHSATSATASPKAAAAAAVAAAAVAAAAPVPPADATPPQQKKLTELQTLSAALRKGVTHSSQLSRERKAQAKKKTSSMHKPRKKAKKLLDRVVESERFEMTVAAAIVTNSIIIGVEVEFMTHHGDENAPWPFFVLQHVYTVFFAVELALRLAKFRSRFFTNNHMRWNIFDFIIVWMSIAEVFLDILNRGNAISSAGGFSGVSNIRVIRIIRIVRLVRIMRIARLLRFFRALQTLVFSIFCTLMSVFWAMFLLLLLVYIFAIIFTQYTSFYLADVGERGCDLQTCKLNFDEECCDILALEMYWSSLSRSMFTCFKTITGGISWHDVVNPLGRISWVCVALCTIYVSFAYFAVLNVVTGVFCHSAIESAQLQKDLMIHATIANNESYVSRVKQLFKDLDSDESGFITINEFEEHLQDKAVQAYFASLELDTSDAWTLWKLLDSDGSHCIEADEFVMGCLRLRGAAKAIDLAKLMLDNRKILSKLNRFINAMQELTAVPVPEILVSRTIGEALQRTRTFFDLDDQQSTLSRSIGLESTIRRTSRRVPTAQWTDAGVRSIATVRTSFAPEEPAFREEPDEVELKSKASSGGGAVRSPRRSPRVSIKAGSPATAMRVASPSASPRPGNMSVKWL